MPESDTPAYRRWWFLLVGAVVLLAVGIGAGVALSGGDSTTDALDISTTTVVVESTTTTTQPPNTEANTGSTTETTTGPTTTVPGTDVVEEWIAAYAGGEYAKAETLSIMWAEQFTRYITLSNQLEPGIYEEGLRDVEYTDDSVTWVYEQRENVTYDNISVVDGKVADFDLDGVAVSTFVSAEPGKPSEATEVTVVVNVVLHVEDPKYGTVTYLTVEIDNQSKEPVYGWSATLVGSDRRATEVQSSGVDSYAPGTITEDILIFVGSDLSDGGELRIEIDYNTNVAAAVPAVPAIG